MGLSFVTYDVSGVSWDDLCTHSKALSTIDIDSVNHIRFLGFLPTTNHSVLIQLQLIFGNFGLENSNINLLPYSLF